MELTRASVLADGDVSEPLSGSAPTVAPDDRLATAAAIMLLRRVPTLAVVQAGRPVGTVSERDVLRAVARGLSTDALCVLDCMTPAPRRAGRADTELAHFDAG